ncbi:hypothetical protein MNBD_ALPHA03-1584, partial [hydrothermal vent metagenome]
MRGNFLTGIGIALIIVGTFLLYMGYSSQSPAWSAIAWASVIAGALALLSGVSRKVSAFMDQ